MRKPRRRVPSVAVGGRAREESGCLATAAERRNSRGLRGFPRRFGWPVCIGVLPGMTGTATWSPIGPNWLLQAKVVPPALPAGYLHRAFLHATVHGALERRLTMLRAPGGFGKTTTLAHVCGSMKEAGVPVGWLSLDEDDSPELFGYYLARALQHAGLDFTALDQDAWSTSGIPEQFGMLVRAIESHVDPCLLALDAVERLPPATVERLDRFLKRSPENLHFVVACRFNPGLDLLQLLLDNSALVVEVEKFRFSSLEIGRFYGGPVSRGELKKIEERTAGWPVAVMIDRDTRADKASSPASKPASLIENFVGVRLMRGLSSAERAFLYDLSVFDGIGTDLVDEVLETSGARLRVSSMPSLKGLLLPSDDDPDVLRLHPLVKDYCARRLAVEDPDRKRVLHRRIAAALAGRGHFRQAWRHATHAGDNQFLAELIEERGVFGLWAKDGATGLASASRFLTPEIVAEYPRLALLRSVYLQFSMEFTEAAELYRITERETGGFSRDRDGRDTDSLTVDRAFTEALLAGCWYESAKSAVDRLVPTTESGRPLRERDRVIGGAWHLLQCAYWYQIADFDQSRYHGSQAQSHLAGSMRYGEIFATIHLGLGAMVQGRVREAADNYQLARRQVKTFFPSDQRLLAGIELLLMELNLERNRGKGFRLRTLQGLSELRAVWHELFLAVVGVRAELNYRQYEGEAVIQDLTRTMQMARNSGASHLTTYVALLLVFYLAKMGRVSEAGLVWNDNALPTEVSQLPAMCRRSWRLMEALWNARSTLLLEQGDFDAAGEVADTGWRAASECGALRVALRCLGLSMAAAHLAGDDGRALDRLAEILRLTRSTDYYRCLASHGDISRILLAKLLARDGHPELHGPAEAAREHLSQRLVASPQFSPRELNVLAEVRQGLRNKEIATLLGITEEGVRYHLRNIFRKAGVSRRLAAVRYAEAKGLLS